MKKRHALNRRNVRRTCKTLLLCLFLTPTLFAPKQEPKPLTEQVETYNKYLEACYEHQAGKLSQNPQECSRHLNKAFDVHKDLQHKNVPIFAAEALLYLLFDAGRFDIINKVYQEKKKEFETTFKDNIDVKLILAQGALYAGNQDEATELFNELNAQYPDNTQIAYYTSIALMKNEKHEEAITYLNKCLENPELKQKHFLFHFLQSKIYEQQKQLALSLESIKKSLELFPHFEKAWLFKAYLHEKLGSINDAILGYKQYLKITEQDTEVEQQLIQLLFSQQRYGEAADYLKKVKTNKPETLFNLALTQMRAKQLPQALESINNAIIQFTEQEKRAKQAQEKQTTTNTPNITSIPTPINSALFTQARLLKIEILLTLKKPTAALAFTEKWLQTNPQNISVIHTLLLLRQAGVTVQNITHSLEKIAKTSPSKGIMAALGDLYLDLDNHKKALIYYNKLLTTAQDPLFRSSIFFQIGHIYFTINKPIKETENILKQAINYKKPIRTLQSIAHTDTPVIDLNKTDPSALNQLAVLYYTHKTKLSDALKLSDILIKNYPECSYYLHTNACLLLLSDKNKKESTDKAIKLLKRAHILAPNDTIIRTLLTQTQKNFKNKKALLATKR